MVPFAHRTPCTFGLTSCSGLLRHRHHTMCVTAAMSPAVKTMAFREGIWFAQLTSDPVPCKILCTRAKLWESRSKVTTDEGGKVSRQLLLVLLPWCPLRRARCLRVIAMMIGLSRTWHAQAASSSHNGTESKRRYALDACFTPRQGQRCCLTTWVLISTCSHLPRTMRVHALVRHELLDLAVQFLSKCVPAEFKTQQQEDSACPEAFVRRNTWCTRPPG